MKDYVRNKIFTYFLATNWKTHLLPGRVVNVDKYCCNNISCIWNLTSKNLERCAQWLVCLCFLYQDITQPLVECWNILFYAHVNLSQKSVIEYIEYCHKWLLSNYYNFASQKKTRIEYGGWEAVSKVEWFRGTWYVRVEFGEKMRKAQSTIAHQNAI